MIIGWIMLIVSDTLYTHVGIEAAMVPAFHRHELKATWCGRMVLLWRIVFGITGQVTLSHNFDFFKFYLFQ